jgi:hypothetical protein
MMAVTQLENPVLPQMAMRYSWRAAGLNGIRFYGDTFDGSEQSFLGKHMEP